MYVGQTPVNLVRKCASLGPKAIYTYEVDGRSSQGSCLYSEST